MWFDRFRPSVEPSKAVAAPVKYAPRANRFYLDVPVSFIEGGSEQSGKCINVSESGLLAWFDQPPEVWTDGLLRLQAGEHHLSMNARVARVHGHEAGFAFVIDDDNDRATVSILVNSVLDYPVPEDDPGLA